MKRFSFFAVALAFGNPSFAAPTPLPYTETLGDLITSGCDSAWYGGVCEEGWTGVGGV